MCQCVTQNTRVVQRICFATIASLEVPLVTIASLGRIHLLARASRPIQRRRYGMIEVFIGTPLAWYGCEEAP
jgi:hypothetical protein